mmetsp:Transcript_8516/g.13043  ORF Transcript_8516/g.13043 Transcript_8516/m.13043 type:complete len:256 (-) Transcript_8516:70-837(-)
MRFRLRRIGSIRLSSYLTTKKLPVVPVQENHEHLLHMRAISWERSLLTHVATSLQEVLTCPITNIWQEFLRKFSFVSYSDLKLVMSRLRAWNMEFPIVTCLSFLSSVYLLAQSSKLSFNDFLKASLEASLACGNKFMSKAVFIEVYCAILLGHRLSLRKVIQLPSTRTVLIDHMKEDCESKTIESLISLHQNTSASKIQALQRSQDDIDVSFSHLLEDNAKVRNIAVFAFIETFGKKNSQDLIELEQLEKPQQLT